MKYKNIFILSILAAVTFSLPAYAVPVSWTDWISSPNRSSAVGQLQVGLTTVGVSYSGTGSHSFVQTGAGINYWSEGTPAAYTSGSVNNAPPGAEGISLNFGGTVTISFSQAILNPYIAMNSWNSNTVDFGVPIIIDSFGGGYWGSGTAIVNGGGTGFLGNGEFHGVVSLLGSYNAISFTHTSENWHGFTVGVAGLAPGTGTSVPEPAPLALFGLGLLGLGLRRRCRG